MNEDIKWILEKNAPGITLDPTFVSQLNKVQKINGAPLSTQDIIEQLKNPNSFISLTMRSYVEEASLNQQIQETQVLLEQVNAAHAVLPSLREGQNSDVDNFFEEYNQRREELANEVGQLNQQLAELEDLRSQRENLLNNWQDESKKNMDDLFKNIDKLLPEGKKLDDKDKKSLNDVVDRQAKAAVYAPSNADPKAILDRAEVNIEVNAMRLIASKQEGYDPNANLNPSDVAKWSKQVDTKSALHGQVKQYSLLESISNNISELGNKISGFLSSIADKAKSLFGLNSSQNAEDRLRNNIDKMEPEEFLKALEDLHKSVADPNKSTAQNQQAFEFKLAKIVKDIPADQKEAFLEKMESHASASLQNGKANEGQKSLLFGAFGVKQDAQEVLDQQKEETSKKQASTFRPPEQR